MSRLIVALAATLTLASCKVVGPDAEMPEFGQFFPATLGQTNESVLAELGPPDEVWFDDCSCSFAIYRSGSHATAAISFVGTPQSKSVVADVRMLAPYRGMSTNGLRIGSTRREVEALLGKADRNYMDVFYPNVDLGLIVRGDIYLRKRYGVAVLYDPVDYVEGFRLFSLAHPY